MSDETKLDTYFPCSQLSLFDSFLDSDNFQQFCNCERNHQNSKLMNLVFCPDNLHK